jgi:hypothetical protein
MAEQSHRDEMNAAIRAQRERHAAPRTIAPADGPRPAEQSPAEAEPPPESNHELQDAAPRSKKSLFDRLRGR